jgi:hypothetical protein
MSSEFYICAELSADSFLPIPPFKGDCYILYPSHILISPFFLLDLVFSRRKETSSIPFLYIITRMPSPLPLQLPSSHNSAITSSSRFAQHRKTSADKPGLVQRTSSTSSLHRVVSNKSNSSIGTSKTGKHHHPHVAHTSASKHNRTTSFGHRVPSYGKGLNKLTALTTVNTEDAPKEHLSIHSIVDRAGGASMQRSMSEGSGLVPCYSII